MLSETPWFAFLFLQSQMLWVTSWLANIWPMEFSYCHYIDWKELKRITSKGQHWQMSLGPGCQSCASTSAATDMKNNEPVCLDPKVRPLHKMHRLWRFCTMIVGAMVRTFTEVRSSRLNWYLEAGFKSLRVLTVEVGGVPRIHSKGDEQWSFIVTWVCG